jgi:predicted CoA-binding protein
VDGIPAWPSLPAIPATIATVTGYLSARSQQPIAEQLLNSGVRRAIFNPGAENPELAEQLRQRGKEVLHVCTLVLLSTGQFVKSSDEPTPPSSAAHETNHS